MSKSKGSKSTGSGWGGARIGSGPKRKSARARWLTGDAGKTGLALVEAPADAGRRTRQTVEKIEQAIPEIGAAGEVPAMLNDAERAYWALWAPLAVANGTLTDSTRPGFVLLCQTAADAAQLRGDIHARGILFEKVDNVGGEEVRALKAHPLLVHYRGLRQRQEQLLARYGLAAVGRIAPTGKPDEDAERAELTRLLAIK